MGFTVLCVVTALAPPPPLPCVCDGTALTGVGFFQLRGINGS